jgi:hypothetical protein
MYPDLKHMFAVCLTAIAISSCGGAETGPELPPDPATAPRAAIDRFSDQAGTLFKRSVTPSLPAAGEPIDLDRDPFITQGLGPIGQVVRYYNLDAMPAAPIWVLYREGIDTPVEGQLDIVDLLPGDPGYSDFWLVSRVTVPADYVSNSATSLEAIRDAGYPVQQTTAIVNRPLVPEGSVATQGPGAAGLTRGWYRDQVVFSFDFNEAPITSSAGAVPIDLLYVAFNVNPDQVGGGVASGYKTEEGTRQTHNVVETVPGDPYYSPLWIVVPYDNARFDEVFDLISALYVRDFGATVLVNCPVVATDVRASPGEYRRGTPPFRTQ